MNSYMHGICIACTLSANMNYSWLLTVRKFCSKDYKLRYGHWTPPCRNHVEKGVTFLGLTMKFLGFSMIFVLLLGISLKDENKSDCLKWLSLYRKF